jgi:Tfp pilus assembly protein PilF
MPANQFELLLHDLANHAWQLDPSSPEALEALATLVHHYDLNFALAAQYLRRALMLQPGNADIHQKYASLLSDIGDWSAAKKEFNAALELDPLSPSIKSSTPIYLFLSRHYKEARQDMEQILQGPQGYRLYPYLGAMYLSEGNIQEGLHQYALGVARAGSDGISLGHQAYGLAKAGRQAEARRLLATLEQRKDPDSRDPFYMATAYGALHDNAKAFYWLEQGFAEHDWSLCYLKIHPYCDDLRADPRFQTFLSRLKLK